MKQKHFEQIEIIEKTIEEGHRPITLSGQPVSSLRESTEKFIYSGTGGDNILESERDVERDQTLLYSPSMCCVSRPLSPPIHQSTPERSISIKQFGYDLHEVQAHAGKARVMETHAADKSSGIGAVVASRSRSSPPGILKHSQLVLPINETEGQWRMSPSESSVQRKDSYRRIQEIPDVSYRKPDVSSTSWVSKKMEEWTKKIHGFGKCNKQQKQITDNSFDRLKGTIKELSRQMREGEWTPRLVAVLIFTFLLIFILLLLFWFIFSTLFLSRSTFSFLLYPPLCEECQRRTGSSYRHPSRLYVHVHSTAQLHFELVGNPPFKSNSFTAVDFESGYIAIADHSLTDSIGRHTVCFIMQLDSSALPDMNVVKDALRKTFQEVHAQFGWQEYWQFTVENVDVSFVLGKFKDRIEDCQNVQWYLLKHSLYTNDESCSSCYDFCLPDYAVLRRQKYEDEVSIGVRRLNCFRLYVPEWAKFHYQSDATGGHFQYPLNQPQNTQRDENGNWVNWQTIPTT